MSQAALGMLDNVTVIISIHIWPIKFTVQFICKMQYHLSYIYIYICVCMCVCVCNIVTLKPPPQSHLKHNYKIIFYTLTDDSTCIRGSSTPASITSCIWSTFPAVILDTAHVASFIIFSLGCFRSSRRWISPPAWIIASVYKTKPNNTIPFKDKYL